MAVLLLYTLQLAVNTVKAVSPPTHPLCMSMFLSLCSQVHCFARWPHPEPGPKWRGARKGSHMEHQIQDSSLFLQMGFLIFFSLLFAKCPRKLRELELPALWMQGSHFPPFR